MRKKVFLAGGVLALFILLGSTHAFAQSQTGINANGGNIALTAVASKLHLSTEDIASMKQEVASGKSIKEVLSEHNITMDQIRSAIQTAYPQTKHLSNTQIATISAKLGIDPNAVQSEINQGKSVQQIMKDFNITPDKLRSVFAEEGIGKIKKAAKTKS